jgi:hypothetical protein
MRRCVPFLVLLLAAGCGGGSGTKTATTTAAPPAPTPAKGAAPCISPLHTHFVDGVLHTEAKQNQFNTLGEFFTEWDVRLNRKCVGGYCKPAAAITIYVDGTPYSGDPRAIELEDRKEIAVVIGSPPLTIPSSFG